MGSYVPAKSAQIGIVDAVFSRVGSSDNLYKGQSTFMVEMLETSIILSNASNRSFVILDEIGRGTSTYDGMSIAFGVIYYLHNILKAKTLFATHYHELTELKKNLKCLKTFYMLVEDYNGELIFMHNVIEGIMDKSYGIYAAKLAGMPNKVIKKAEIYLNELEKRDNNKHTLPLFDTIFDLNDNKNSLVNEESIKTLDAHKEFIKVASLNNEELQVIENIKSIRVEEVTPLQALEVLNDLKQILLNKTSSKN
ncbi:UNVERIFIED_CONTAM: hypothetical protein PYX00_011202 [Menopon gallinae]|uniref:DNA mismatch repair proteins mutS family domain-containing protein n=1 Tax=Menopon gallinae TaxID=328185 RepID=A0AAW2H6G4_9NEOP